MLLHLCDILGFNICVHANMGFWPFLCFLLPAGVSKSKGWFTLSFSVNAAMLLVISLFKLLRFLKKGCNPNWSDMTQVLSLRQSLPLSVNGLSKVRQTRIKRSHLQIVLFTPSYRPQRSCGKVMFSHASVSHSVHRGGVADTSPLGRQPQEDTPLPSRRLLQRMVRILLECILVGTSCSVQMHFLCKFTEVSNYIWWNFYFICWIILRCHWKQGMFLTTRVHFILSCMYR